MDYRCSIKYLFYINTYLYKKLFYSLNSRVSSLGSCRNLNPSNKFFFWLMLTKECFCACNPEYLNQCTEESTLCYPQEINPYRKSMKSPSLLQEDTEGVLHSYLNKDGRLHWIFSQWHQIHCDKGSQWQNRWIFCGSWLWMVVNLVRELVCINNSRP